MEHKITEALGKGSLYEAAAKSIAPEIFGHQDVTWRKTKMSAKWAPAIYLYNNKKWIYISPINGLIHR